MLNKENYVSSSLRLLRYVKIRPNGKLIYNFIINGPYVRRMIPEPGDANCEVPVPKTFHEQTDDELTKAEFKQMEVDDQAIQTILLGLPEDLYAAVDSCEIAQEIWLRVQQMMKGSDIGIKENKAKLFNECERFTSSDGESIKSYYHRFSKLMNDFKRNKHFPEKIASNLKFLNNLQLEQSRHVTIVHQTKDLHTADYTQLYDFLKGLGHLARNCTVRPRRRDAAYLQTQLLIAQKEEVGIQHQAKEFHLIATAADLDEIEKVNENCILMANLQQASTSGTQTDKATVYDSDGSAEVHNYSNCYDNEIFNMFTQEEQYTELLEPIPEPHQVQQNNSNVISEVSSVELDGGTVDQHPETVEETRAYFESLYNNLAIEVEKFNPEKSTISSLLEEIKRLKSDFKIHEDELLDKQIQLENKIKELDNILVKTGQSIQTMHMLSPKPDSFYHTEHKMDLVYQNPFYLKQAQQKQQSLYNGKVLLEKHDPPVVYDSDETLQLAKEIVSQDIMSIVLNPPIAETSDLQTELERVDNTAKTRRPQPKSNIKNDRVPSTSKSSCTQNKEVQVEEHLRNLLLSKNKKHMSSECNNVKLAIRNAKSEVVCAICKKCLITANHDVCVLKYVNDMNSRGKKQKVNVSNTKNQKKQKPMVMKPKKVGSKERLASPKPSKPRSCLSWTLIGRLFDLKGKIITSSESESQSDCSNGDNACTSNPPKPTIKWFLNSTSFLGRVYNIRIKKIIEIMNVTFDELLAMAFEQSSSKPRLQGMTFRQISSELDLTYAPSIITTQQPTEGELDLLFEAMYDDYIGG
nr:hypothetical protein [Tanacetum cinerariifolium]